MELQQLRYVVAVAETGGFTRAAERCLVVQSALSHQIAKLEKELGARLFERNSRQVRLTPAGEAFLPAARQSLEAAERAAAEVAAATGEIRGTLALGAISTIASVDVPRALRDFHDRYPQVRIRLTSRRSEDLVEEVRGGTLDLAFLGVTPAFRAKGVRSHTLVQDRHVVVVAPDHPLAREGAGRAGKPLELARLAEEAFVDFAAGSNARAQTEETFAAAGLHHDVAFEVSHWEFLAALVRNGMGIALLPATFVSQLSGLCVLPVRDGPRREERLVWSETRLTPAGAAFLAGMGVRD
ncbi:MULTISPECIES: LysR family transcriptional regulator [unclassified Streptomyces]|uniref:LysR family transcriptional regulator n=1 Tax=unclassified Streptomyces TaxID=2593676 RepID=UPI002DD8A00D|nr:MULTISPECIES: LysR family transcriptional regulator [unclassified Streptomyces]WSA95272.1 LysR family transcriptional regulator [Streptomyces sp. NBC_01795]WSB79690.1 LysR family transcriptional regulator [Streptomyces sp. NBC_01775]WSS12105.1 LysR family transcriptional regulator [Streptomyces sp. NBC_01186]WSS40818.1 LysR family transcriptional regulator [Streptomyces sp. NBC_01187]